MCLDEQDEIFSLASRCSLLSSGDTLDKTIAHNQLNLLFSAWSGADGNVLDITRLLLGMRICA